MSLRCRFDAPRLRGFTLVEILVVLVIVGILLAMAMALTRGITAAQKRSLTATRMAAVDAALIQYLQQNRRLPCPADGTTPSGATNAQGISAGFEVRSGVPACKLNNVNGSQQNGVVPWGTLGLSEADATDGWDRRLTYRVHSTLIVDNSMDMSQCDPAGSADSTTSGGCAAACVAATVANCTKPSNYLAGSGVAPPSPKGFTVKNTGLMDVMVPPSTGAAYVVISHGETGGKAYLGSGQLSPDNVPDSAPESVNHGDLDVQAYYVDDGINDNVANHFDDLVSRPSVLTVITKAGLGPRAHN